MHVASWFGVIGVILTTVFIPDTIGLDLREQERYRHFVREGRSQDYHGVAVHPWHLSWYERVVLKRYLACVSELDLQARTNELQELYEMVEGKKAAEPNDEKSLPGSNEADLNDNVSIYFEIKKASAKKQPQ